MKELDRYFEADGQSSDFSLLTPLEFYSYLQKNIPQAQRRAWVQTMNFEADHFTGLVNHMLENAAKRGVDSRFTTDHFYKMVTDGNIDYIPAVSAEERQYRALRRQLKYDEVKRLQNQGVVVNITNPPRNTWEKWMPGSGRNHIKMAIIDDVAFVGGVNLSDKDFSRTDFMIKIQQPELVSALVQIYQEGRPLEDYSLSYGNSNLLVDSGQPGKSIILDTAIDVIKNAKESVTVTSQFTPDGKLPHTLDQVHKNGIRVETIVSKPDKIFEPPAWLFDRINAFNLRMQGLNFPILEYDDWLHIKVILIDEETASPTVIVGTHNFSGKGVKWGNQEIAFLSTDIKLINDIKRYINMIKSHGKLRGK